MAVFYNAVSIIKLTHLGNSLICILIYEFYKLVLAMVFDILKEVLISNSQEIYKIINGHIKMRSLAILTLRVSVLFDGLLNFLLNKWP